MQKNNVDKYGSCNSHGRIFKKKFIIKSMGVFKLQLQFYKLKIAKYLPDDHTFNS
jgi:hypothetical protein